MRKPRSATLSRLNLLSFQVDKVTIAQESVARFMNDICPSAYTSMTKVSTNGSKWLHWAYFSPHESTLTHWAAAI